MATDRSQTFQTRKGRGVSRALAVGPMGQGGESQSGSSSLKVRVPEIMVETMDCRDMMSSRMAA